MTTPPVAPEVPEKISPPAQASGSASPQGTFFQEKQAPEVEDFALPAPEMEVPPELEIQEPVRPAVQPDAGPHSWPCSWEAFLAFCADHLAPDGPLGIGLLRQIKGRCLDTELVLDVESQTIHNLFNTPTRQECLRRMATDMAKRPVTVQLGEPSRVIVPEATLREEAKTHPAVRLMIEEFDASVHRCLEMNDNTVSHG